MCLGLEAGIIGPILASGLGAVGQIITMNEQQANAKRQADARNKELARTLMKNDAIANDSRAQFQQRLSQSQAAQMDADQQASTEKRQQTLEDAVTPIGDAATAEAAPISGSAPTVVKSELAKKISEALSAGKDQAKALGTLGGYGDSWLNQGFADTETGRQLGVNSNIAGGNMALLPYAQDFAEYKAYKPVSPIGGLLSGFGSMLGSYSGGGGAVPRRSYTSPFLGRV